MVNYFHLFFIILVFIIWKETLPFIRDFRLEDKIKRGAKIALILLIMFFTLFTQSVSFLIGLNNYEMIDASIEKPLTSLKYEIENENKEELENLRLLLKDLKVKYSLKRPSSSYTGQALRVLILTEKGFKVFLVTEDNYIWHNRKYYRSTNDDLFNHIKKCLNEEKIYGM